ncbi:GLPGLI family protein [Chitinophaga japonensis]|uniref:GLPGLI family protein n=1 Tax=Chitinophaga japonensis TaxID=104662 RepID=A0A562SYV6_CHIJA|nr:GLPGLI family protein [Chitinophaga japonensis]TWI86471.1 GLPGLI family protein [Chitinophaga japonensis]
MKNKFLITLGIGIWLMLCTRSAYPQQYGVIKYYAQSGRLALASPPNENGYPFEYENEEGILYFNNTVSLYQQLQNETITQVRVGPEGTERIKVSRPNRDTTGWLYFKNIPERKILCRESYWNKSTFVYIGEELDQIDWNISNQKKNIGKYVCVKATANFLGRSWMAWFAPEIPVSIGPWKLWGLPGAILEASDSQKDFLFTLKEIEIPSHAADKKLNAGQMTGHTTITREEYRKQNTEKKNKYVTYMQTVANENDGTVEIKFYPEIELY